MSSLSGSPRLFWDKYSTTAEPKHPSGKRNAEHDSQVASSTPYPSQRVRNAGATVAGPHLTNCGPLSLSNPLAPT